MSNSDVSDAEEGMDQLAIHDEEEEEQQQPPAGERSIRVPVGADDDEEEEEEDDDEGEEEEEEEDEQREGFGAPRDRSRHNPRDEDRLRDAISRLSSPDNSVVASAAMQIRRIVSVEVNPPLQVVIDAGGVPLLVSLMDRSDDAPVTQFEAAWALTNIASGTSEQTQVVVDAGALPIFIRLLASPHEDVCEQAAWAIGNIAGDSIDLRDTCLQAGAMPAILTILRQSRIRTSILANCAQAISNLTRGRPSPQWDLVEECIPVSLRMLGCDHTETLSSVAWTLSYLSDDSTPHNAQLDCLVGRYSVAPALVRLMGHPSPEVRVPALRAVGNIVAGADRHTRAVLDAGGLPALRTLLSDSKPTVRREAAWTLSNCTDHVDRMLDADVFPPLVNACSDREEVAKQALWALANSLQSANAQQRQQLLAVGCVQALSRGLGSRRDEEVNHVCAEGLLQCMQNVKRDAEGDEGGQAALAPFLRAAREAGVEERMTRLLARTPNDRTDNGGQRGQYRVARTNQMLAMLRCFFDGSTPPERGSESEEEEEEEEEEDAYDDDDDEYDPKDDPKAE